MIGPLGSNEPDLDTTTCEGAIDGKLFNAASKTSAEASLATGAVTYPPNFN